MYHCSFVKKNRITAQQQKRVDILFNMRGGLGYGTSRASSELETCLQFSNALLTASMDGFGLLETGPAATQTGSCFIIE